MEEAVFGAKNVAVQAEEAVAAAAKGALERWRDWGDCGFRVSRVLSGTVGGAKNVVK